MNEMIYTFAEGSAENGTALGGKGGSLVRLYQAGFPVPDGFVVLPNAFGDDELKPEAWAQTLDHLDRLRATGDNVAFAVRSSALSEDSAQASFAGAFETVLNVRDDEAIYEAIHTVHCSRHSERVDVYSRSKGMDTNHEVAVVVQRLVPAEISGVLFTANPLNPSTGSGQAASTGSGQAASTGSASTGSGCAGSGQAMITASWGLGEAVVGGLVTPDTLIIDKESGRVLSRETGSKQVQTVLLDSKTEEQPVPQAQRRLSVLTDEQTAELLRLGLQIEDLYGMPMDIEWTLTEGTFAIVQARPITTLRQAPLRQASLRQAQGAQVQDRQASLRQAQGAQAQDRQASLRQAQGAQAQGAQASVELEWKLPQGSYMAVRNNIVELMADPLTPLFGTLGLTSVNHSMGRLLTSFFGRSDLMPADIIINVNDYAYYNGSWSAGQMTRILLGSVGIAWRMFSGAVERWTIDGRLQYAATVQKWQESDWRALPAGDLLEAIRALSEAAVDAYGSLVSGVIPAAWISEGLFTFIYDKLIKRGDDPPAPAYLLGFDSTPIQSEKSLYDLAMWARTREELVDHLSETETAEIVTQLEKEEAPRGVNSADWGTWRARFQAHLAQYGHAIYNLDFANPVPADDPAPLLETCKWFMTGEGVNPHTRQEASSRRREEETAVMLARLKGLRLKLFRKSLTTAQRYAPLRESGLADVGLGYPLLRQMMVELGRRFAAGGMIADIHDIYWLEEEEVLHGAAGLDRGERLEDLSGVVSRRKVLWREAGQVTAPPALPQRKFLGLDIQKMKAVRAREGGENRLKGVAASPGSKTAPACVVHGPEDFAKMKTGDVLVAAMTTPAWTPLIARASAIVTDVGGPLSHGSIVAREYGIPAVLGTGEATRRIHSGQRVTVNGSEGIVLVGESLAS